MTNDNRASRALDNFMRDDRTGLNTTIPGLVRDPAPVPKPETFAAMVAAPRASAVEINDPVDTPAAATAADIFLAGDRFKPDIEGGITITPNLPRPRRSGSTSGAEKLSVLADEPGLPGAPAATPEDEGSLLGQVGGYAAQGFGGLLELLGQGGAAFNNLFGYEADDPELAAQRPGNDLISDFLIRNGRGLMDYGEGVVDRNTSERAKEIMQEAASNWSESDSSMAGGLSYAGTFFQEGGREAFGGLLAGAVGTIIGSGGVVGGGRVIVTKAGARLLGTQAAKDGAEAGVEAIAAGQLSNFVRTAGQNATRAELLATSAAAGGLSSYDAARGAEQMLEQLGEDRKQLPIWQRTKEALELARGEPVADEVIDLHVVNANARRAGFTAAATTHLFTVLSPVSEGAFSTLRRRVFVAQPARSTFGSVVGGTGRATALGAREAVAEGFEERIQTGVSTDEATATFAQGGSTIDALLAGYQTQEASEAAIAGALAGGALGAGISATSRRVNPDDTPEAQAQRAAQAVAERNEQTKRVEQDAVARREAAEREAAQMHNNVNAAILASLNGNEQSDLGDNQVFGVGSTHGNYSIAAGSGVQADRVVAGSEIVFSSDKGAVAVNPSTKEAYYAAPDKPTTWVDAGKAPTEFVSVLPSMVYLGSTEGSADLDYQPGIDAALALARNVDPAIGARADQTFAGLQTAALEEADRVTAAFQEQGVETALTQREQMAELRRAQEVNAWRTEFSKAANNGAFIPPVEGVFDGDDATIGINDYAAIMRDRVKGELGKVQSRLSGDARAATNFVRGAVLGGARITEGHRAVIGMRADPAALREIVAGRTRQIATSASADGTGNTTTVTPDMLRVAETLLEQAELQRMYQRALDDPETFGQEGVRSLPAMQQVVSEIDRAQGGRAAQSFEELVAQQIQEPAATLGDVFAAQQNQSEQGVDQIERSRQLIEEAETVQGIMDAINLLPGTNVGAVLKRADQTPNDVTQLLRGEDFAAAARDVVPATTQGPSNRYGPTLAFKEFAPSVALQGEHTAAMGNLAQYQLAKALKEGTITVREAARRMITRYGVAPNQARDLYLAAVNIAEGNEISSIQDGIKAAQQRLNENIQRAKAEYDAKGDNTQEETSAGKSQTDQVKKPKTKKRPKTKQKKPGFKQVRAAGAAAAIGTDAPGALAVQDVHAFAETARARFAHLKSTLSVVVHNTLEDAKSAVDTPLDYFSALYVEPDSPNGKAQIHLVADRFSSQQQLESTFDHELVGHFGLSRLLGPSLHILRDTVASLTASKGADGATLRRYREQVEAQYRPIIQDMLAQNGQASTPAAVNNALAAQSGVIMDEVLAAVAEDAADGTLKSSAAPKLFETASTLLRDVGFNPQTSQSVGELFAASRDFVNNAEPEFIKQHRVASQYRSQAVRERVENPPLIKQSWIREQWAKLASDAIGIRNMVSLVNAIAPGLGATAENVRFGVETSANRAANVMRQLRAAHVNPLKTRMTEIKKELSYNEAELYAQFSSWAFGQHAGERNRSYFLLNRTSGLSEDAITERDRIKEEVLSYADDNNQRWGDALSRIEKLFAGDNQAAKLMSETIQDPDYVGVSGMSQRQIDELNAGIDPAFVAAATRADLSAMLRNAQEAVLEQRRRSGVYGENGYKLIRLHNWQHYIPIGKDEVAQGVYDDGKLKDPVEGEASSAQPTELLSPDAAWLNQEEGIRARSDTGRLITGGPGSPMVNVLHTLDRDVYYAAHETVNAEIGRQLLDLVDGMVTASPMHAERVKETFIATTDTVAFGSQPRPDAPSKLAKDTWVVHDEDGNYRIMQFRDKALATSMGSRFDTEAKGGLAKITSKPTQFMARAYTSYNPGFVLLRQIMRDAQQNVMIAMSEHGVPFGEAMAIAPNSVGYVPPLTKFFHQTPEKQLEQLDAARKDKKHPLHRFAQRYDTGGVLLFEDQFVTSNRPGDEFRITSDTRNLRRRVGDVAGKLDAFASAQASAMDNAARQALFDALLDQGKTAQEATDVVIGTLNFANRSQAGRALSPYFAFAQTAMSGLDAIASRRLWRDGRAPTEAVPDGNGGFRVKLRNDWGKQLNVPWLAARIAMGYMATAWAHSMMDDGEDDDLYGTRSLFQRLDPYTLMTNIAIPTGTEEGVIKVPMQVGFDSLFHAMGAATYMMANDPRGVRNSHVMNSFLSVGTASLTPFSTEFNAELGVTDVLQTVMPTVLAPITDAGFDSMAGRYNKLSAGFGRDARTPGGASSSPFITAMTREMQEMLGANVAPETIEYLLQNYTGGIFTTARNFERVYQTEVEGGPLGEQTPGDAVWNATGLFARDTQFDAQQSYYHFTGIAGQLEEMVSVAKSMDGDFSTYSPGDDPDLAGRPNLTQVHRLYGPRIDVARQITRTVREELTNVKREIDALRARGNPEDLRRIGPLRHQQRVIYEQAATAMRRVFTEQADGAVMRIQEPEFRRFYAE